MYELTRKGMEELHGSAEALLATDAILDVFLRRYGEFLAMYRGQRAASRRD